MANDHRSSLELSPYPPQSYGDIDLNRLAVVGVHTVQEMALPTTLENITVALFRLFPLKFSLGGFEYPDSNRVNRALLQLRPKYRNWVAGDVHSGLDLTPTGREVLDQTRRLLQRGDSQFEVVTRAKRSEPRTQTLDPQSELEYVRNSVLFSRFREGLRSSADLRLVYDVLRVFPYTPREAIIRRLRAILNIARDANDQELVAFLEWLRHRHPRAFDAAPKGGSDRG